MISVLMPSRGRPELCDSARKSALDMATGPVEILVYVDEDDPKKKEYKDVIIGPPRHSGKAIKYLSTLATGDLMFFGCDDFIWQTKGWDRIFEEKMPDHKLSVLFPRDQKGANKSITPCFSRRWVKETGLFPDDFNHFGPDTWVIDTARKAGTLIRVEEVLISHTKVKDDTFHRSRSGGDAGKAKKLLDDRDSERQNIANKIKELCTLTPAAPQ